MAETEGELRSGGAGQAWHALLPWAERLALPLVLALALVLRLYGIDWDGGGLYHPDERAILTHTYDLGLPALSNLGVLFNADESPLNPRWFPYGTLPIYALKALQLAISPLTNLDIVELSRVGRVLSALADTATVAVVYKLGLLLFNRRVGLLAAGLVAMAVLHIQLSHFFAAETFQTLFTTTSLYFMVQVVRRGRLRDSLWAGLFVGLAMATKVSSAPILLPLALAHVFAAWRQAPVFAVPFDVPAAWWRQAIALASAFGLAAAAFIVTEPYALLDSGRYIAAIMEQSEVVRRIRDYPYTRQYVDTIPVVYQAWHLTLFGLGPLLGLVALGGLVWAGVKVLWRGGAELTLLLAFLVPLLVITASLEVKFLRYLLPATPLAVLLGAAMLFGGVDWVRRACAVAREVGHSGHRRSRRGDGPLCDELRGDVRRAAPRERGCGVAQGQRAGGCGDAQGALGRGAARTRGLPAPRAAHVQRGHTREGCAGRDRPGGGGLPPLLQQPPLRHDPATA